MPQDGRPILHSEGQSSPGQAGAQEDVHIGGFHADQPVSKDILSRIFHPFVTLLNNYAFFFSSEDKGALAKLVEAIKTNYNDRYEEVRLPWRL